MNVRLALPGVGENLRDHYAPRMKWSTLKGRYTYNDRARGLGIALEVAKYVVNKKGFLALPCGPNACLCKIKGRTCLSRPWYISQPFLDKKRGFPRQKKRLYNGRSFLSLDQRPRERSYSITFERRPSQNSIQFSF